MKNLKNYVLGFGLVALLGFGTTSYSTGIDENVYFDNLSTITKIDLPNLVSARKNLYFDASKMTKLNLPSLTKVVGNLYCDSCINLTTVNIPLLVFHNGQTVTFDNDALNVASVDHILARAVASKVTSLKLYLDGGKNSAPSSIGQGSDYAILVAAGNTITKN